MRNWLGFFERYRWTYVGTVHGVSVMTDFDGKPTGKEYHGYWILSERGDGKRRATQTGDAGHSPFAEQRRAAVKAWLAGGPCPSLEQDYSPVQPPRKREKPKKTGNVISFPRAKT